MCFCSFSFPSVFVGTVLAWWVRVLMTSRWSLHTSTKTVGRKTDWKTIVLHALPYWTQETCVCVPGHCNSKVESMYCNVGHTGIQRLPMKQKTLFLYHREEVVIKSDELNYLLCNNFGHVAFSRLFFFPFESICKSLLLPCLCLYCLSELQFHWAFYVPY